MTATLTNPRAHDPHVPTGPASAAPPAEPDPSWARPALLSLLGLTSVLYLWGLSANGWANSFYSAAVQAGTTSWSAFFFGSSDAAGSITVDKPPASLWVMELSARVFGVNSWSILVPEALMGVGAVYLLYLTVRRWAGAGAGLLAGSALAVTPVATLMFRFNNPDAMLVLLMVAAVYATVRAIDAAARRAGTQWLLLAGGLVGLAFLTKSLQALLVVPGLALVFLVVAPVALRRRLFQLLVAGLAMLVSGLWWVVVVTLIPASSRPYIGGSQHNSVWELIWGYNGLGRLTGNETGSVGGNPTGGGMWGSTGLTRLFSSDIGGQIAWLLPAALVLLAAGLWFTRRAPRTDRSRGLLIVWGGWLLVTGLTFSEMKGIFHQYYTVALAPAVAALVGVGAASLWRGRRHLAAALTLAGTVALTAVWSFVLLDRSGSWHPWLRTAVLVGGLVAALGIAGVRLLSPRMAAGVAGLAVATSLAGPAAYSVQTASVGHSGSIVTAGPAVAGSTGGGPGGGGRPGGAGGAGGFGGPPSQTGGQTGGQIGGQTGTTTRPAGGPSGVGGGAGGLLNGSTSSAAMTALLKSGASSYRWVAAAIGSQNASGYQLASGHSVMPIGGFNGSDPSPTLAEFKALVARHEIHYFIASGGVGGGAAGGPGGGGGQGSAASISSWVEATFTARTVGGVTVYDLTT